MRFELVPAQVVVVSAIVVLEAIRIDVEKSVLEERRENESIKEEDGLFLATAGKNAWDECKKEIDSRITKRGNTLFEQWISIGSNPKRKAFTNYSWA